MSERTLLRLPGKGPNVIDRVVEFFSPTAGLRRRRARASLALSSGLIQYTGARGDRPQTQTWTPAAGSADSDTLPSLPALRARSRDAIRNFPLALAAMNAAMTEAVGPGFRVKSVIDHEVLGLTEDEAQAWEARAERLFRMAARNRQLDFGRRQTFTGMQYTALWSVLESGDLLVVRRQRMRPGDLVSLKIQLVEADRVSNPNDKPDTDRLVAGVEMDDAGAPVAYHVRSRHPGDDWIALTTGPVTWSRVPAWGRRSGLRLAWLMYRQTRANQTRGVPYLAPIIEALKQLSDYGTAELHAAVVNSLFAVIVKSQTPETAQLIEQPDVGGGDDAELSPSRAYKLGSGLVIEGADTDTFEFVDPKRPNHSFEGFVHAWMKQIGAALGIPFEVLIKHFGSSYSASQASMLEAFRFFESWQQFMVDEFCQPVYELFITECVAVGLLDAPGFFEDPLIRAAWLGTKWIGPRRGVVRPDIEIRAARDAVDAWLTTAEDESARIFGADWEHVYAQRGREVRRRDAALEGSPPTEERAGSSETSNDAGADLDEEDL